MAAKVTRNVVVLSGNGAPGTAAAWCSEFLQNPSIFKFYIDEGTSPPSLYAYPHDYAGDWFQVGDGGGGSGASWGGVTGTLANQTDLQAALDAKAAAGHTHSYEAAGAVAAHEAAGDPHTGYQRESEKGAANGYAALDAGTKVPIAQVPTGNTASTACVGNDARLSDARTPLAHAATHASGGGDAVKLDDLAAPDDNTDLNASAAAHGLFPKLPGGTTTFWRADGTWAAPAGGSGLGYTLSVQALTSSPVDGQTVYFGNLPKAPTTTAAISRVYLPKTGTIKAARVWCYSGTAGTGEAWSLYVRLNNTTDTLIQTLSVATNARDFGNTGLSIAVTAGDYIEIKGVQPTWATNPLTTIYGGYVYIE